MNRTILKWLVMAVAGFLLLPLAAPAQEKKPEAASERPVSVYRLDYVIHELDNGKQINQRKYTLSVETGRYPGQKDWGRVRVGRKVPVATSGKPGGELATLIQYMDVGVNLDCALEEQDNTLLLETRLEISSVVTGGDLAAPGAPVTRQARTENAAVITPGKPTIIATLDDVDSTRSYQIEVTATRMK